MRRFKNMCKMAGCIFVVNLLLDRSVFDAVKDQLAGDYDLSAAEGEHEFYESRYGDFETLVTARRRDDMFSYLPRARANLDAYFSAEEIGEWFTADAQGNFTLECMKGPGIGAPTDLRVAAEYRDKGALGDLCRSQAAITTLLGETTDGGAYDPANAQFAELGLDPSEPHWERAYYANGFVEEFWEAQRCNS